MIALTLTALVLAMFGACGLAVAVLWIGHLEDRLAKLERRAAFAGMAPSGRPYLWSPFGCTEIEHD